MSLFDPQSDPEYCAHECRECDQPMQKEFPRVRGSDWICVNHSCKRSPFFESVAQAEEAAEMLGGALEVLLGEIGTPEPRKRGARLVFVSPHLVHHAGLIEMKQKQDEQS